MKTCPQCNKTYSDDNLNFCLDDGSPLTVTTAQPAPTVMFDQAQSTQRNQPIVIPTETQSSWNTAAPQFSMQPPARSSKTWIWVVGILAIIVVGCGGALAGIFLYTSNKTANTSNNNNSIKTSPSPSPSSTLKNGSSPSPSPSSSVTTGNTSLKTGTYNGSVKNMTYNQSGDLMLRIDSVDSSGNVNAFFAASHGLQGSSTMTGKVDDSGKLTLAGKIEDGRAIAVSATVNGSTIRGGYGIAGGGLKSESGTFTVSR